MKKILLFFLIFIINFALFAKQSKAVMPPDFIFNFGSQIWQFFSVIFLSVASFVGILYKFLKIRFHNKRSKKVFLTVILLVILTVSFSSTYIYTNYKQEKEYQKWLKESKGNSLVIDSNKVDDKKDKIYYPLENDEKEITSNVFFEKNKDLNMQIDNSEFDKIVKSENKNFIVLDVRENREFQEGNFPGSVHIRFADIRDGKWKDLQKDKFIYVMCWSGIRGKEAAMFLREKKIMAFYLTNGVEGWQWHGGAWNGDKNISEKYSDIKYRQIFTLEELKSKISEGAILVDCRSPEKFQQWQIEGSVNLPILYTPSKDLKKSCQQIKEPSKIITICDDNVNCLDARITGIELESRGHEFLGRFNRPWDYK